jgi:hypothetical protein
MTSKRRSIWLEMLDSLESISSQLATEFPCDLPPENSTDFWFRACELEMSTRDSVSVKLRSLLEGPEPIATTPLESWFFRRRIEWATQLALAKVKEGAEPDVPLPDLLHWALISTWETDGCLALWNHAERDGKPHPDNPEGLSPT